MAKNLTRSWQAGINDKITGPMIMNKLRRTQFIDKLMEKKDWIGTGETVTDPSGPRNSMVISFLGSATSAIKIGGLQDAAAIQISDPIRGLVESYVDMTGAMKVRDKDIDQHKGKALEKSLLGEFERQVTYSMNGFKNTIEDGVLNDSVVSTVTSIADIVSGILTVSRPEKFEIGLGFQLAATAATTKGQEVFVIAVNKSTGKVTFSTTLGSTATNLTNFVGGTAAATTICINGSVNTSTGAVAYGFDSLESILLSSTNGGGSTYLGKTKTAYPFLQAAEVDGSSLTASDFLPKLFEHYHTNIKLKTKHPEGIKPQDVLLSPLNYTIAMISLERYKGDFYKANDDNANPYGWNSIKLGKGNTSLRLTEVESLKDSIIPVVNMDTFALVSDGGIKFVKDQNNQGNDKFWYPTRTAGAAGYTWICDYLFAAQFVCGNPESNGIFYGVSMSL